MSNNKKNHFSEELTHKLLPEEERVHPVPLSVIIPVYNCSEVIGMTLESLQRQKYDPLETIIIDAGSTDRTLEIVNSYASLISRIYTVATFNTAEMINRGISLATGKYIAILFPGTVYLSEMSYQSFAEKIEENDFPDLIYCGSIQREIKQEPQTIFLPFEIQFLEKGRHPSTIPACWFRADLFEKIGKFDSQYTVRLGFDFYCRFVHEKDVKTSMIDRIFVDFDYGRFSYGKILRYARETWNILSKHFGIKKAFLWFLTINHVLIVKWMWRRFKAHIFERG